MGKPSRQAPSIQQQQHYYSSQQHRHEQSPQKSGVPLRRSSPQPAAGSVHVESATDYYRQASGLDDQHYGPRPSSASSRRHSVTSTSSSPASSLFFGQFSQLSMNDAVFYEDDGYSDYMASASSSSTASSPMTHRKAERSHSEPKAPAAFLRRENSDLGLPLGKNRYKTELCRAYLEAGHCKYGEKCQFAHGRTDLRSVNRHPKYKTEKCRSFHATGLCQYGGRCHFIHHPSEAYTGAPDESTAPSATAAGTAAALRTRSISLCTYTTAEASDMGSGQAVVPQNGSGQHDGYADSLIGADSSSYSSSSSPLSMSPGLAGGVSWPLHCFASSASSLASYSPDLIEETSGPWTTLVDDLVD